MKLFESNKLVIPLADLCKSVEEGSYSFLVPTNVKTIGSHSIGTLLKKPKVIVDVAVEMPAEYFNERDYLNYRYFMKRNLYMAHVYIQLVDKKKYSNLKFEFVANYSSTFKPLLILHFDDSLDVCLHFVPNCNSFKLHRFNPNQCNVRAKWFQDKFKTKIDGDKLSNF